MNTHPPIPPNSNHFKHDSNHDFWVNPECPEMRVSLETFDEKMGLPLMRAVIASVAEIEWLKIAAQSCPPFPDGWPFPKNNVDPFKFLEDRNQWRKAVTEARKIAQQWRKWGDE